MASAVIGSLRVNLGIDSAQFSKGLKGAESRLSKFGRGLRTGLLAVGAAAATAAVGLGALVKSTINTADEMSKAAQKIGVPIEELSRLRHAADLSGVSFEQLQTGVGRLSRVMNDANNGLKEATDSFSQLGVEFANEDGTLRSVTDVMADMADRFAAMPDGAEKTALAMELMGRSGANMIPLLNDGADSLKQLTAEADQFGQVFSAETGQQAEAFNDNLTRLQGVFSDMAADITAKVLPSLERFSQFLVENGPQIGEFLGNIAAAFINVAEVIAKLITGLQAAREGFQEFRQGVLENIEQVKQSITEFAESIITAFTELPQRMFEIGAAIIDGLWDGLKSKFSEVRDSITGFASGLADSVKNKLGIQSPSKVFAEIGTNIMDGLTQGMQQGAGAANDFVSTLTDGLTNVFGAVIEGSKSAKEAVSDLLKQLAKLLINKAFERLLGGGFGGGGFFGGILGGIGKLFGFAQGGSFQVGGSGGLDSQLVAFKASPNETVSINKPGQERGAESVEVTVRGVFVDDNGVVTAKVETMGVQAAQAGAAIATRNVQQGLPGMLAETQVRRT